MLFSGCFLPESSYNSFAKSQGTVFPVVTWSLILRALNSFHFQFQRWLKTGKNLYPSPGLCFLILKKKKREREPHDQVIAGLPIKFLLDKCDVSGSMCDEEVGGRKVWCLKVLMVEFGQFRLPGGSDVKESARSAGDLGSISGSGRSPWDVNGNLLQYYCLENSTGRGAWHAAAQGVAKGLDMTEQLTHRGKFSLPQELIKHWLHTGF